MSKNLSQVSLAETYKSKAFEAFALLKSIESQIEEKKDLLKSVGVTFKISGYTVASGTESGFSQSVISNAALYQMVKDFPHISESIDKDLKRIFHADYSRKPSIFSDQFLFERVEQELERLRLKEMQAAIDWVKTSRTPNGYSWKVENYETVPEKVRLMATPDVKKSSESWRWQGGSRFDNLRQLEIAFYSLDGESLPDTLLGDKIYKAWEEETVKTNYNPEGIESFNFKCKYFSIRAYRSAPDLITFTPEALALLNQNSYNFTKWWNPSESEAKAQRYHPEDSALSEVIEFEKKWLFRRAELRKKAYDGQIEKINSKAAEEVTKADLDITLDLMGLHLESIENLPNNHDKKAKLEKAQEAQNIAIAKHPSSIPWDTNKTKNIIVEFSEKNGFIVYGSTREVSQDLGRNGLGFSYWGAKKIWYIRGSKGKPWSDSYQRYISGLNEICKTHRFVFLDKTKMAKAA